MADLVDGVIFLDISPEALRVAETNFRVHFPEKRAQFIVSDLLSGFISPSEKVCGSPLLAASDARLESERVIQKGIPSNITHSNLPFSGKG